MVDGEKPIIMKELVDVDDEFDDIVEGEYIENNNCIIIHDIITLRASYDIIVGELSRYAKILNKMQKKITFATKTIKRVKSVDDIHEVYKENAEFENDGLIFTHVNPI